MNCNFLYFHYVLFTLLILSLFCIFITYCVLHPLELGASRDLARKFHLPTTSCVPSPYSCFHTSIPSFPLAVARGMSRTVASFAFKPFKYNAKPSKSSNVIIPHFLGTLGFSWYSGRSSLVARICSILRVVGRLFSAISSLSRLSFPEHQSGRVSI